MTGRRVEVEIDELVLHGFEHRDRRLIADAVQAELTRAFGDWPGDSGRAAAHLDAGAFDVAPATGPEAIGRSVARQIRAGLD